MSLPFGQRSRTRARIGSPNRSGSTTAAYPLITPASSSLRTRSVTALGDRPAASSTRPSPWSRTAGAGCNGATRAALALAELGCQVKEMLGGFEYWVREGFSFETWQGRERRDADPLTTPVDSDDCGC